MIGFIFLIINTLSAPALPECTVTVDSSEVDALWAPEDAQGAIVATPALDGRRAF